MVQTNLERIGSFLIERVQELEGSSHLIGGHQVFVVQVRLSQEESNDGDLSAVQVVGDAKHVVSFFRRRLGLSLHEVDDVLALAGSAVVVHSALPEHLEGGPGTD